MKCLSLWQPWAMLCVIGAKQFETRHWSTKYRGPLLIHAARRWTSEERGLMGQERFASALNGHVGAFKPGSLSRHSIPLGCIVGIVELTECYEMHIPETLDPWLKPLGTTTAMPPFPTGDELIFGNYANGRVAWHFARARKFTTPIPFCGRQTIFNVPDELVAEQLQKASAA